MCMSAHIYAYTRTHKIDSSEKMSWDSVSALKRTLAECLLGSTSLHVGETQLQTDKDKGKRPRSKGASLVQLTDSHSMTSAASSLVPPSSPLLLTICFPPTTRMCFLKCKSHPTHPQWLHIFLQIKIQLLTITYKALYFLLSRTFPTAFSNICTLQPHHLGPPFSRLSPASGPFHVLFRPSGPLFSFIHLAHF